MSPEPGLPGSETYANPELWSTLGALPPNNLMPPGWRCPGSRQSRQSVWVSCSERAAAMSPPCCRQQLQTRRCGRFARCPQREQLPTCMSFIPSCAKVNKQVNKARKRENVLPSQPFLLHFSKQFFWFIGSFIFHSKL